VYPLALILLLVAAAAGAILLADGAADKGGVLAQCELDALRHSGNGDAGHSFALCMRAAGYERRDNNPGCKLPLPSNATPEEVLRELIRGDVAECYVPVRVSGQIGDLWDGLTRSRSDAPDG
jgi:hypothetical protein